MKARLETGNSQPQTVTKLCRGCFEVPIPVNHALCDKCDHIQKLQQFVNTAAKLQSSDATTQALILSAKPLVRE